MAGNKTQATDDEVESFLAAVPSPERREDARALCAMMARLSGELPRMWGSSIVGFGRYHYKYESGREGEAMMVGFSPRAGALTLYVMDGFPQHQEMLGRLGKYKMGKSCLYIARLHDVDVQTLERLIAASLEFMRENHGTR